MVTLAGLNGGGANEEAGGGPKIWGGGSLGSLNLGFGVFGVLGSLKLGFWDKFWGFGVPKVGILGGFGVLGPLKVGFGANVGFWGP